MARISVAIGSRGSTRMQSFEAIEVDQFLDLVAE
jgi:uncharacterized protein with GYD domain